MLNNLKLFLGIEGEERDSLLKLIIANTTARLKLLLGGIEPPESMDYIVLEVCVMRYNRIGSEGLTAHSVEGESQNFVDSDFDAFSADIQAFLDAQKESTRGKVRFL